MVLSLSGAAKDFLELIYPEQASCALCERRLSIEYEHKYYASAGFCSSCLKELAKIKSPQCFSWTSFKKARAVGYHSGFLREALHNYKFVGKQSLREPLGRLMAFELSQHREYKEAELIVPIPLHRDKFIERGFNQAEQLAEELGRIFHLPVWKGLARVKPTLIQSKLSKRERIENVRISFSIDGSDHSDILGKKLLLIDDVITTGATCHFGALELLRAGAKEVLVFTLAAGIND